MRKLIALIVLGLFCVVMFVGSQHDAKTQTAPGPLPGQAELAKPRPDWSKVGTKLSERCAREIMSKRVSSYCEAEGKAWSDGLTAKLNDPRFRAELDDIVRGR